VAEAPAEHPRFEREAVEARRLGRLGAILFGFGALFSIPSSLMLEPPPSPGIWALIAVALCSALACYAVPWERLGRDWLNLVAIVATFEVAVAMALADPSYGAYCLFVAIFVAYVIRNRRALLGHLALITIALLAPIFYEPGSATETARVALLLVPGIALAAVTVAYLRERFEETQRMYEAFAEEAFDLIIRIKGKPLIRGKRLEEAIGPVAERTGNGSAALVERVSPSKERPLLDEISEHGAAIGLGHRPTRRPVRRPAALAGSIVTLTLIGTVALALAGISPPGSTKTPLEKFGITLPDPAPAPNGWVSDERGGGGEAKDSGRKKARGKRAAHGKRRDVHRQGSTGTAQLDAAGGGGASAWTPPGGGWSQAPGLADNGGVPPGLANQGGVPPGQAKKE
jgi:hypothetical protein